MASQRAATPSSLAAAAELTASEQKSLQTVQEQLRAATAAYTAEHPELLKIVSDFTRAIVTAKPQQPLEFAREYFAAAAAAAAGSAGESAK